MLCTAYVSKHNSNREKQAIFLTIPTKKNGKLNPKDAKLSPKDNDYGIIFFLSKIIVIFIVWIVFIPLEQNKLESHKRACENKDFCNVIMLSEDTNLLEFNQF